MRLFDPGTEVLGREPDVLAFIRLLVVLPAVEVV